MATKRAATKKPASKKSPAKQPPAGKGAKKGAPRAAAAPRPGAAIPPPPINLRCILACVSNFNRCRSKGVDEATCEKRLQRCLLRCRGVAAADAGADEG